MFVRVAARVSTSSNNGLPFTYLSRSVRHPSCVLSPFGKNPIPKSRLTAKNSSTAGNLNLFVSKVMADPGGGVDGEDSHRGVKRTRGVTPDPYEAELAADERESNQPEVEPDTCLDPYAPAKAHKRELERRVTAPVGPSSARTPPMVN